jgi:hypothetical protein
VRGKNESFLFVTLFMVFCMLIIYVYIEIDINFVNHFILCNAVATLHH